MSTFTGKLSADAPSFEPGQYTEPEPEPEPESDSEAPIRDQLHQALHEGYNSEDKHWRKRAKSLEWITEKQMKQLIKVGKECVGLRKELAKANEEYESLRDEATKTIDSLDHEIREQKKQIKIMRDAARR